MIEFHNLSRELPYKLFKSKYNEALAAKQKNIDAISISSYDKNNNDVSSRFVNLKYVIDDEFIFFTNYNSPKALSFESHKQIAALIFWPCTNVQIRLKAFIKKTSKEFNQKYFYSRSREKNALAISSNQSQIITSFDLVKKKYEQTKKNRDLTKCPEYWGGYCFSPFQIEFWEGNEYRLNKRNLYRKEDTSWNHFILEP